MSHQWLLIPFEYLIPVAVLLAVAVPPHVLLLIDLALVVYPTQWQMSGVDFDATDLIFGSLLLILLVRRVAQPTRQRLRNHYLLLWFVLGILVSLAYINAPINKEYLSSPTAIAYQVYRYSWKPILYFPLTLLVLDSRPRLESIVGAIVLSATACSVRAFSQGYSGQEATGPFVTKNQLGGALIMPLFLTLSCLLWAQSRRQWYMYAISSLLIARGLLFAGSRGAFVAVVVAAAFAACCLLTTSHGRTRTLRLGMVGVLLAIFLVGLKPDVFERPTVQHLLTTTDGLDDDNMRWRLEERWPYFIQKSWDYFWLGTGTDLDPNLGDSAITPHNGYLGIAVVSGVPSLIVVVCFSLLALWNGILTFRHAADRWVSAIGVGVAAAIVAMLVHNMVDQTLRLPFAGKVFWILTATVAHTARHPNVFCRRASTSMLQARRPVTAVPIELQA